MDDGLLTSAIYIDLKKAFDTVDHELLLRKILQYGANLDALCWFIYVIVNMLWILRVLYHHQW